MEHDVMGYEDRFIMPMPLYYMSIMEMRCNIESKAIFLNIFSSVAQGKSSWEDEMVCLKRSIFVRCREVRILLIIDTGGIFLSLMTMMSPLYFPPLLHRYWTSFLYLNVGEMMTRAFVYCINRWCGFLDSSGKAQFTVYCGALWTCVISLWVWCSLSIHQRVNVIVVWMVISGKVKGLCMRRCGYFMVYVGTGTSQISRYLCLLLFSRQRRDVR